MSDTVQQIKDKLDIVEVISPYVELHKAGKNFKGKSPFSAEKTPSFYVSPDRGMYYCFSTSQGGDMFTFIQAMEGVDFKEALRMLAQKAGVELVPENPETRSERERQYAALESATSWFQEQLQNKKEALEYLERRGVKKETITNWRIGYAPGPPNAGWREIKQALETKGFTTAELLQVGLVKTAEGGKEPFDVFRDRVMFPMSDTGGKVVAFSGRILSTDSDAPKYVNSPETALYKKSELLYGYNKAKHGIRNLGFSLIVEGQFDVVMCHQAGYNNTVAVSGTALTLFHVQLLERLSEKVVLALDADRAGIAAMKKAAQLMLSRGLDVKVAELPDGKDPADIVLAGVGELKKVVGHAVHVIEFLLHVLMREAKDARQAKLAARDEILPFVLLLPNRIDQEHFVGVIAKAIGSTTDAIRFELERLREENRTTPVATRQSASEVNTTNTTVLQPGQALYAVHAWLLAAQFVFDKLRSDIITNTLVTYLPPDAPIPNEAEVSAVTFTLEHEMADKKAHLNDAELLTQLNLFKKLALKRQLSVLRARLTADVAEDVLMQIMHEISKLETMHREPLFDESIFSGKDS